MVREADKRKQILIVDDMLTILEHAKQQLKSDYRVIPSTSGAQALEILSKITPDIILLDVNMPDMDGFETARQIRERSELDDVPIIMITTDFTIESENLGFTMGVNDFLRKPFTNPSMTKRIEDQLMLAEYKKILKANGQL